MTYFIINTNKRHRVEAENIMLNNHQAMTFGHCAGKLKRIHNDDRIFLYSNGNGIIAKGIADGNVQTHSENDIPISTVRLGQFQILNTPLTASRTRNITGASFPYMHTLFSINNRMGEVIWLLNI